MQSTLTIDKTKLFNTHLLTEK